LSKLPTKTSDQDVNEFLKKVAAATSPQSGRGRLMFAMDATASREPTWDSACMIQGEMFKSTAALGGIEIQLVYYRGFRECRASKWVTNAGELLKMMTGVMCRGGATQIEKVFNHAIKQTKQRKINAVVFVGDAMEEDIDSLCHKAGELKLLGVPVFIFHEGGDTTARRAFEQMAELSGGAYCSFDVNSAEQLRDLLSAVAVFAAGGRKALLEYGQKQGGAVLRLTHQLSENT
jgi:hypothetical protein